MKEWRCIGGTCERDADVGGTGEMVVVYEEQVKGWWYRRNR